MSEPISEYPFKDIIYFLGQEIRISSTHSKLIEIIKSQFLYENQIIPGKADIVRLYLKGVNKNLPPEISLVSMDYRYDHGKDLLFLTYLEGGIEVVVDYKNNSIEARIALDSLPYESAIGNWTFTIPVAELLKKRQIYFMHAAAVEKNGAVFLFPGKSGAGKTTFSIGMLAYNWNLVSDDEVFLSSKKGKFIVRGDPAFAKISSHTWNLFQEIFPASPRFSGKKIISLKKYFPEKIVASGILKAVFLLHRSDKFKISELDKPEALKRLLSVGFLNSKPELAKANFEFLSDLVLSTPVYKLDFNLDFKRVCDLLPAI